MTDDIEEWYRVRARWVVDLLRCGVNVAVIGRTGIGKSTTMRYAQGMLADYDLTDRVEFINAWPGGRLPRRAGELFVVEVDRYRDIPNGFAVVPVISLRGTVQQDDRSAK